MSQVILFYRYVEILDEEQNMFIDIWIKKCTELEILGRILVASEGVNGTLAGTPQAIESFIKFFVSLDLRFEKIDWKFSSGTGSLPFLNLTIKKVKEIVSTGQIGSFINQRVEFDSQTFGGLSGTGQHLSPEQFHSAVEEKDGVLLDIRNEYEFGIGHFEGAVGLGTFTYSETFTALDQLLERNHPDEPVVSKPIYMYCTGGIRCEKASAYLCAKGYQNVYQLEGGIHRYLEKFPDGGVFKGKNFVFDRRVAVPPLSVAQDEDGGKEGRERRLEGVSSVRSPSISTSVPVSVQFVACRC